MKRVLIKLFLTVGLVLTCAGSWAGYIIEGGPSDGEDVGALDTLIAQEFHNGSGGNPAGEKLWAETELGVDLIFSGKTETVGIYDTDTLNVRAFALAFDPGWFIVKNSTYRGLFANVADTAWGVIDISALLSGFNLADTTISHVTEFNDEGDGDGDGDGNIPVPGTLLLLGLGLLGFRFVRKA